MKKMFVSLCPFFLLLSFSCTTPKAWRNIDPNHHNETNLYRDMSHCEAMAASATGNTQIIPVYGNSFSSQFSRNYNMISAVSAKNSMDRIYLNCMKGQGWRLENVQNDTIKTDSKQSAEKFLEDQKSKKAWEDEVNAFGQYLSINLYGKNGSELDKKEFENVSDVIFKVDQWKKHNNRNHYSYKDAYILMTQGNAQ